MDKLVKAVLDRGHSAVHIVQREYLFDWMTHKANDIRAMTPLIVINDKCDIQGLLLFDCYWFRMVSLDKMPKYLEVANSIFGDNYYNDFVDSQPGLNNLEDDVSIRQLYDLIVANIPQ